MIFSDESDEEMEYNSEEDDGIDNYYCCVFQFFSHEITTPLTTKIIKFIHFTCLKFIYMLNGVHKNTIT